TGVKKMTILKQFDVVIVGASVGGCTAATLYSRRGLSVALLERTHDDRHYKKLCTHFIQPVAVDTLRKLGLDEKIEAAGGLRNQVEAWTKWGWIRASSPAAVGYGYNVRRQTLDPLLRTMALESSGVHYFPGTAASALLRDGQGRICGVAADGGRVEFVAPLVVAADGRNSRLAELAGIPVRNHPNQRINYFTYYRGLPLRSEYNSQYWHLHPNLAYAFRNDDNTTLLGISLPQSKLSAFRQDPMTSFRRFWATVPGGPHLDDGQPLGELLGIIKFENAWRPAAVPGLALVGDAATVMDPIWGTGCGFAFASADWLVECTTPCFASPSSPPRDLDRALRQYAWLHRARLRGHYWHVTDFSKLRKLNLAERLLFSAATRDSTVADCVLRYFGRTAGVSHLAGASGLWRALLVNLGFISPPSDLGHISRSGDSYSRSMVPIHEGVKC
ncbi:MAG TPA: NAD(P)/FAD-dependent oxidoreductase, partial [Pirellulales bacterium]|nr:NAD(P)/FAD-dependent oxidoreductase [Pirellulales bacterium]